MAVKIEMYVSKGLKVTVTGQNVKEAIKELTLFSEVPTKCPRSGAPITFKHRKADENDFYEVVSRSNPEYKSTLGQHRNSDTLFYKNNEEWKSWEEIQNQSGNRNRQDNSQNRNQKQKPKPEPEPDQSFDEMDDDLPF